MGIYIKGMEMPKCCKDCFGCKADLLPSDGSARGVVYLCCFTRTVTYEDGILDNCPLVEVPTHGRLIDADAIEYNMSSLYSDEIKMVSKLAIDKMPTIIEEDGKE